MKKSLYFFRSKRAYFIFGLSLIVATIGIIVFPRSSSVKSKIEEIQQHMKPQFDSLSQIIYTENNFQENILLLIKNGDLMLASNIVDSAMKEYPYMARFHVYKGMIYYAKRMYKEAICEYDSSIAMDKVEYPFTLSKRAESLIQLKKYNDAITDYRKASDLNSDFEYQLAKTFELNDQIDSAILHYGKYLADYPKEIEVQKHLNYLISLKR